MTALPYADAALALNNYFRLMEMPFTAEVFRDRALIIRDEAGSPVLQSTLTPMPDMIPTMYLGPIEHTELGMIRVFNKMFYGTLDAIQRL